MFNLSTSGNVGYNGISQLAADVRCAPQSQYKQSAGDSPALQSIDKMSTYIHTDGHNNLTSPTSRLKLPPNNDDVYTFRDSDSPVNNTAKTSNVRVLKGSFDKTDMLVFKKGIPATHSINSTLRVIRHVNGVKPNEMQLANVIQNGGHDLDKRDGIRTIQLNNLQMGRVTVKQNKDLFSSIPSTANDPMKLPESPPDSQLVGLNHCTKNSIISYSINSNANGSPSEVVVKKEPGLWSTDIGSPTLFSPPSKISSKPAIRKLPSGKPPPTSLRSRRGRGPALHEALQRIKSSSPSETSHASNTTTWHAPGVQLFDCGGLDFNSTPQCDSDDSDTSSSYVQQWWSGWSCGSSTGDRAERLASRRAALRRRTTQLQRSAASLQISDTAASLCQAVKIQTKQQRRGNDGVRLEGPALDLLLAVRGTPDLLTSADRRRIRSGGKLMSSVVCAVSGCRAASLSCARLCLSHITLSQEQRLFAECTAKFSDNTQCRVPVVNIHHELPLCTEHAWKRDNYNKISQESKPKKAPRKRPKPSAMIRPQKRSRKRKRPAPITKPSVPPLRPSLPQHHHDSFNQSYLQQDDTTELNVCSNSSACESSEDTGIGGLSENEFIAVANHTQHIVDPEVVAQVLAMQEAELVPLGIPEPGPPRQTNIDLSTVFNDFFAAEQNGEYIPTREETEELERALEAVDEDVKSLEKLTASQSHTSSLLLESLLDERDFETLASLPDVFSPGKAAAASTSGS